MNINTKFLTIPAIAVAGFLFLASKCTGPYINGKYHGISRANYTEEYYGNTTITVKNGWITRIDFCVRDSAKHELFDAGYEHYFADNPLYVQQCRNDWQGVNAYPDSLLKYQDIRKVDARSGATWSFNLFRSSVKEAMVNARKKD
jgi:major membrane immunogen (membrane-anchored lipoprotein)